VYLDPRDELLDDVRSGGLAAELNRPPGNLDVTPALAAQLDERQREAVEYGNQTRRLQEHAGGLEAMLEAGGHRSAELSARVEELSASEKRAREQLSASEEHAREELSASEERAREQLSASEERAREELSASEERAREELRAAAAERQRLERALAGLRLECDSMRDATAEFQRRHEADLHAKEAELVAERGKLDFELMIARQEALRLQTQLESTANALNARSAEMQELLGRLDESENARRGCEQMLAQLKLETYNWQDANERAAVAEAHLADIMRSRSWRLTMPARQFMTAMRARRKTG
jgi:chromosome segregation ATPase